MKAHLYLLIGFIGFVLGAAPAHGDIVWTGKAGNNQFFDPANWDFSGSKMTAEQFTRYYDVTDNLVFKNVNAVLTISGSRGNTIHLAQDIKMTFQNSHVSFDAAVIIEGRSASTTENPLVLTRSTVKLGGLAKGVHAQVDGQSVLSLAMTENAINSDKRDCQITLQLGGSVEFPTGNTRPSNAERILLHGMTFSKDFYGQDAPSAAAAARGDGKYFILKGNDTSPFDANNSGAFSIIASK